MKTIIQLFIVILLCSSSIECQENALNKEVMVPIKHLFDGMRRSDTTLVKLAFYTEATMQTVMVDSGGSAFLRTGDLGGFVGANAKPHEHIWDERIYNEKIEVDGNFAQVWVDYTFYVGDNLSHCGVDAFHLIKENGHWKIFQLVDTRRKENCIEDQ